MSVLPEKVLADLKSGKYEPVYFLQGDEPFFIDQISDYIESNAIAEAEKSFNQTIIYGKDAGMADILTNARRFPMMAEKQLVLIKEAQNIPDLNREDGQKLLINYLDNPVPSTILVFAHKHKKVDGRRPLAKALKAKTVFVESIKLKDYKLPAWISQYVKSKGFNIDDKTAYMLAEYIGTNLERLTNEIGKVLISLPAGGQITQEIVHKNIGISKEYNVFEFQKAIAFRDVLKANRIANFYVANSKANPIIPTIGFLFSYFSKLLLLHGAKDKSDGSLASTMGVPPFAIKDYKVAANNYSVVQVINSIGFLKKADLQSKGVDSGSKPEGDILRELVFNLMH
jgi:DNA polymerase III subunit delta